MTAAEEQNGTWLEEVKNLIRRKQAENVALKKIQESFLPRSGTGQGAVQPTDDDQEAPDPEKEQKGMNENNHQ